MLTPDKIKSKSFQTTGMGSYRSEDVNNFFEEVSASYEQLFKENSSLIKKLSLLANKVEEYKKDEDSLRHALLTAQKLADQIVAEAKESTAGAVAKAKEESSKLVSAAKEEADKILSEAKKTADKLVSDARYTADSVVHDANAKADEVLGGINRKATQEKLVYDMLQKEVAQFRTKLMDLYKEHLTLLDKIPAIVDESKENIKADNIPADIEKAADEALIADSPVREEPSEPAADTYLESEIPEEASQQVEEENIDEAFELSDFAYEDESEAEVEEDFQQPEESVLDEIDSDDGFSLSFDDESEIEDDESDEEIELKNEIEDVFSSENSAGKNGENDGFSLNISDIDDEDFDEDTAEPDDADGDYADIKDKYASLEDSGAFDRAEAEDEDEDEDDEDDGSRAFKKFFRKK